MKELRNLETLNNRKTLVTIPVSRLDEDILANSFYNLANQTNPVDVLLLLSDSLSKEDKEKIVELAKSPYKINIGSKEDGTPFSERVESSKSLNCAYEEVGLTIFSEYFNYGFNKAVELGYTWYSVVEKDDLVELNWIFNFEKYSSELEDISIFFPIVRQVTGGGMTGHLNEATWLEGKVEVAGQADLPLLMSWNCLSPTGCFFKVEEIKEYVEEREGKLYPLKEKMSIGSSYEFFLRMIYEDIKTYTIPRYGYQMRKEISDKYYDKSSSKIPSNITILSKEEGGMTAHEVNFWLEQAKSEYFLSEDREIEYEEVAQ
jgi:hypothetical protein